MNHEHEKSRVQSSFEEHVKDVTVGEVFAWIRDHGSPHVRDVCNSIFDTIPQPMLESTVPLNEFVAVATRSRDAAFALTTCAVACAVTTDEDRTGSRTGWMKVAAYLLLFAGEHGTYDVIKGDVR